MKVVIDTNVLIAAFISPSGKSSVLLEHCATLHEIVCSELILDELRDKLTDKFHRDPTDVADALDLLRTRLQVVSPLELEESASRDPDDDIVLGTALAGQVERVITGDKDLLVLGTYRGIRIVNPATFLQEDEMTE